MNCFFDIAILLCPARPRWVQYFPAADLMKHSNTYIFPDDHDDHRRTTTTDDGPCWRSIQRCRPEWLNTADDDWGRPPHRWRNSPVTQTARSGPTRFNGQLATIAILSHPTPTSMMTTDDRPTRTLEFFKTNWMSSYSDTANFSQTGFACFVNALSSCLWGNFVFYI